MATGLEHENATMILSPVVGVAVFHFTGDVILGCCAMWGCYMGIYVSPDLDIAEVTRSERIAMNRYAIVGRLYYLYWIPYGRIIPHRHPLSHWPVLGTVLRVFYLLAFPFIVSLALGNWFPQLPMMFLAATFSLYFLAAVLGLCVADAAHWAMDVMPRWNWMK